MIQSQGNHVYAALFVVEWTASGFDQVFWLQASTMVLTLFAPDPGARLGGNVVPGPYLQVGIMSLPDTSPRSFECSDWSNRLGFI